MFWIIALLLLVGIFLMMLEIVLPYGMSFIAGLCVIGLSCYLAFRAYSPGEALIYVVAASALSGGCAFYIFRSGIRLTAQQTPPPPPREVPADEQARERPGVGEIVEVVQVLRPTGTVRWRNHRFPARSARQEEEVTVGVTVRVKGHDSSYLIVEPSDLSESPNSIDI